MSHCHHTRNQFDEPHERMRGGWSDNHEGGGRRDAPDPYFGSRHDDYGYNHGDAPAPPMQQHEGANLGWGDAAWDDAGGFESVLWGHLANNFGPAGGSPPVIVFAIDDLNVEFNTLIQITQIQNTPCSPERLQRRFHRCRRRYHCDRPPVGIDREFCRIHESSRLCLNEARRRQPSSRKIRGPHLGALVHFETSNPQRTARDFL